MIDQGKVEEEKKSGEFQQQLEDKLDDLPMPILEAKSNSLVPPEQFKNLHPRMLYEVLKHVKDHGSVNVN